MFFGWSGTQSTVTETIYWPIVPALDDGQWKYSWNEWAARKPTNSEKNLPRWGSAHHRLHRSRTRDAALGSWQLTAWAVAPSSVCRTLKTVHKVGLQSGDFVQVYCLRLKVFSAATMKNVVFWDIQTQFVLHRRHITSPIHGPDLRCSQQWLWRMPSSGI
jgi:hypothetical protein